MTTTNLDKVQNSGRGSGQEKLSKAKRMCDKKTSSISAVIHEHALQLWFVKEGENPCLQPHTTPHQPLHAPETHTHARTHAHTHTQKKKKKKCKKKARLNNNCASVPFIN